VSKTEQRPPAKQYSAWGPAIIFGAPSTQEQSASRFGTSLLFDIGQIDGVSLHYEPNCLANDQDGRLAVTVLFGIVERDEVFRSGRITYSDTG
jgi:hypothetical protein